MRILVTGGAPPFLSGKRLCETLQGQGHTVQVVSREPQKVRSSCLASAIFATACLKLGAARGNVAGEFDRCQTVE